MPFHFVDHYHNTKYGLQVSDTRLTHLSDTHRTQDTPVRHTCTIHPSDTRI